MLFISAISSNHAGTPAQALPCIAACVQASMLCLSQASKTITQSCIPLSCICAPHCRAALQLTTTSFPPDHTKGTHCSTFPLDSARHLVHHTKSLCTLCHQSCCLHASAEHQPYGPYPILKTMCSLRKFGHICYNWNNTDKISKDLAQR